MEILRLPVGRFDTNSYALLCSTPHSLLVDPGGEPGALLRAVSGTELTAILLTHGHADHTEALVELTHATGAPVGVHPADAHLLPVRADFELHDGQIVRCGPCRLRVHHLPGHTAGSVGLQVSGHRWLVGDTVFPGGPGHTDSPADFAQLMDTLWQRIFALPRRTRLLPGHGEATSVGREHQAFHTFLRKGWAEGAYGDIRWDTRPVAPACSSVRL
jgi:glyoxylase-like metal-dependent hydrolase (beta-lactamase superfamily II)